MTVQHISPDGHWRWDGAHWVPNVDARALPPAQTTTARTERFAGGIVGAAVLAPVIFPSAGAGDGIGLGLW